MTIREKVIKGLECCAQDPDTGEDCIRLGCPYFNEHPCIQVMCCDALALLKAQTETINDLYGRYDGLCKEIREKYESDDVCGLCQYDGAYKGESGDWMNECPGFEANDCFCMKNSIRKMCGQPLIEEP